MVGAGGLGGGGGTPQFGPEYYAYFEYMLRTIRAEWVWRGSRDQGLAVGVRFSILSDGRVADVRLVRRSINPHFDQSVLNAVRSVEALTPAPPRYRAQFSDVELIFRPGDLG